MYASFAHQQATIHTILKSSHWEKRWKKVHKSNSIDYVSKVRQQKIGTSPEIMPLQCKEQKIQKRIFTNSSPKVQMGRMS